MRAVGVRELPEETRLAHARLADHRHHLAVPARRAGERLAELIQLHVPAHEAGEPPRGRRLEPSAPAARPQQLVDLHRGRRAP